MPRLRLPDTLTARPFTPDQAAAAGFTGDLARLAAVRRVWPGVYVRAEVPDDVPTRLDALLLLAPDAWATCHTAAQVWGLPVPTERAVHVGYPPGRTRPRLPGLVPHLCQHPPDPDDLCRRGGRLVESPLATFVRMRNHLRLLDLVALGDAVVRGERHASVDELRVRADGTPGRGRRHLAEAARLVRLRVDSPMETRVRLLLRWAGLPEPETGWELRDADGILLARQDMAYPQARLAVEYDGRHHDRDPRQRRKDKLRRDLLDACGWRLVSLDARDVFVHARASLMNIHAALHARGVRVPMPTWDWERYVA